jgi:hypothetical protein
LKGRSDFREVEVDERIILKRIILKYFYGFVLLRTGSCGHDNERDDEAVNMKIQRRVVWYTSSNISEEHAASIFSV